MIPATLTRAEEREWVDTMVARLERAERRRTPTDDELLKRARGLSDRYLGGMAEPESVRWVDNQQSRWGSCTPGDRTIRLSARLQGMPPWVVDYVLVHELAHLLEPGHDAAFWGWVDHYPQAERAKGYLLGWSAAAKVDPPPGQEGD
jgi:predicted metal-dependent hydrolase